MPGPSILNSRGEIEPRLLDQRLRELDQIIRRNSHQQQVVMAQPAPQPVPMAVITQELQANGSAPLQVDQLLGQLAQPQIPYVPTGTAVPSVNDPQSQDGALFLLSTTNALYRFAGSPPPGAWVAVAGGTLTNFTATPASVFDVANPTTAPALSLDNQNANTFLSGPASGAAATPAFRAPVPADTQSIAATVLASTTLNLNTSTKQTLYTVPTGKGCIILAVVGRQASVDLSAGTTTFLTFGFNAGATDWSPGANFSTVLFTTALLYRMQDQGIASGNVPVPFGGSAAVFGGKCDAAFGSAANLIIDVIGFLF